MKRDNSRLGKMSTHLSFDCKYYNLQYQSKLGMKLRLRDNIHYCRMCMHLKFSYSYCNLLFANKSSMTWKIPGNIHYCKLCMHLKFSCRLSIRNLSLNIISNLQNLQDNILNYKSCKQKRLWFGNQQYILLYIKLLCLNHPTLTQNYQHCKSNCKFIHKYDIKLRLTEKLTN